MPKVNCAIYTRKSTERWLDMEFNSLQNQEEACNAYILSQSFNGGEYYKTYSDGGISGGTMERPGLQELLTDIRQGQIQIVVVYKVDRLSRSIIDFHKMMQEFDKQGCNFVSITQSFDTSNSMGKLTLNMLLSFAQFEREVSAERVRDKIAASKAKGMWMGGSPPLGYKIIDKQLIPEETEIPLVRLIFEKYLEIGHMQQLASWLNKQGYHTKQWIVKGDHKRGGKAFKESSVRRILSNPVYIGKISHLARKKVYPGKHRGIITNELFEQVQEKRKAVTTKRQYIVGQARQETLLSPNLLFDDKGNQYNLTSSKKGTKRFRYYFNLAGGSYLPTEQLDQFIIKSIRTADVSVVDALADNTHLMAEDIKKALLKVVCIREGRLYHLKIILQLKELKLALDRCPRAVTKTETPQISMEQEGETCWIKEDFLLDNVSSVKLRNTCANNILTIREMNESLVRGIAYGWRLKGMIENGLTQREWEKASKLNKRTFTRYLNLCYLSPQIIGDILEYKNPRKMTLRALMDLAEREVDLYKQNESWNL